MLGQLIPVGGGDPIPLNKPVLMVGRRPSCDIRLEYANVSSHHCRLEYIHGYWRAADISRNGTKVNGERIEERFLQPGDTLSFAKHAYEIQYVPDPEGTPPTEEVDPFAMSLLEKAGLASGNDREHRSRSSSSVTPRPTNGATPPKPVDHSSGDDDLAMEWLR